jgi:hypothetical protein
MKANDSACPWSAFGHGPLSSSRLAQCDLVVTHIHPGKRGSVWLDPSSDVAGLPTVFAGNGDELARGASRQAGLALVRKSGRMIPSRVLGLSPYPWACLALRIRRTIVLRSVLNAGGHHTMERVDSESQAALLFKAKGEYAAIQANGVPRISCANRSRGSYRPPGPASRRSSTACTIPALHMWLMPQVPR